MTRKKVKFGALPTENMPKKSHETRKPPSRPAREIVKEVPSTVTNRKYYKGLTDVSKRIKGLKTISEWKVTIPTSAHLGTMPTPSEFRGQFPVKAETREAERTNVEHGSRLLMQYCRAGKN